MSGGSSFNEVFFTDVELRTTFRLGEVGRRVEGGPHHPRLRAGLGHPERRRGSDDLFERLVLAARHRGMDDDPLARQALARLYIDGRVRTMTRRRVTRRP